MVERHEPFLSALAANAHHASGQIDVLNVEAHQLAESKAGGIEQLQDCAIAAPGRTAEVRSAEHLIHLLEIEVVRQCLFASRRPHELCGIIRQSALSHQIPRERTQRRKTPGRRRSADSSIVQGLEESPNTVGIERSDWNATGLGPITRAQELDELRQIGVIGANRVRRGVSIELQKLEELPRRVFEHHTLAVASAIQRSRSASARALRARFRSWRLFGADSSAGMMPNVMLVGL